MNYVLILSGNMLVTVGETNGEDGERKIKLLLVFLEYYEMACYYIIYSKCIETI
jgi:hypothetical protein